MSENLFAYTATNSGYSEGTAGAINGDRAATATALSAVKNKMTGLNGDPAFFNFFDRNSSRLVLRQYNYTLLPLNLIRSLTRRLRPGLLWLRL